VSGVDARSAPRRADVCATACAEVFRGAGEVLASAFGTVPALGARLAKATFAPDLLLTDGEAYVVAGVPGIGARGDEPVVESHLPFRRVFDVVWSGRRRLVMMASQVDRTGNQNISAIGPWGRPTVQLIGVRGAPGNTVNHPTSYWVPNHSPRTFVDEVDVVAGVGTRRAAQAGPAASRYHRVGVVVSDLAVVDFDTPEGVMRLRSVHPGVTVDEVVAATGCPLVVDGVVPATRTPSDAELELLCALDPEGLRYREVPA
jgi:acyl CoA:acetate/3-ketoacid CoA transferase beta subunit